MSDIYVIKHTVNGKTETLNVLIPATSPDEAIFKAFDLSRIVTGHSLPQDGSWTAHIAAGED